MVVSIQLQVYKMCVCVCVCTCTCAYKNSLAKNKSSLGFIILYLSLFSKFYSCFISSFTSKVKLGQTAQ